MCSPDLTGVWRKARGRGSSGWHPVCTRVPVRAVGQEPETFSYKSEWWLSWARWATVPAFCINENISSFLKNVLEISAHTERKYLEWLSFDGDHHRKFFLFYAFL